MEGKILLQDLAQSLAAKRNMPRKEAEAFMKAFFETISDGILQDKIVKIKGLGTFKMIEVQERESVNVNTGERIVIPGHSKISFTPDAELKNEVNKPFALFQTVVINEGTSLDEMEKVDASVSESDEELPDQSEPEVSGTVEELAEAPVSESAGEEPAIPEYTAETEPSDEQINADSNPSPATEPYTAAPVEDVKEDSEEQPVIIDAKKRSWWYVGPAMTALLAALFWIVFLVGYFIGCDGWVKLDDYIRKPAPETIVKVDTVFIVKPVQPDSARIVSLEDSLRKVMLEDNKVKKEEPKVQARQPEQKESKLTSSGKKTSVAFEIVGYKGSRTIQWGEYLLKIVRQEYGTDDALRYVISYNNFTNPDNVPVGTEVKLPKLRQK